MSQPLLRVAPELRPFLTGYEAAQVRAGKSSASVYRLTHNRKATLFLKTAAGEDALELQEEFRRLTWLADYAPVPQLIAFAMEPNEAFLLLQGLEGRTAEGFPPSRREAIVSGVAHALRQLHEVPVSLCPFDQRLDNQVKKARTRTLARLVDESDFDAERHGFSARELLELLETQRPEAEDLVVTHGDACLPNMIFAGDRFTGFIDCGRTGVADRYQDLALAGSSIAGNFSPQYVQPFFDAYGGLDDVDHSKLSYYRLLDEFF